MSYNFNFLFFQVQGFNPDVLRQVLAFLSLAPAERPYDMKPTVASDAPKPENITEFIPLKKKEVIVVQEEKYIE
jgi:hypothetical protein